MKIQLLMIITVVISSLLTISQRVSAHEVSQLRWLEPTVEQRFTEVVVSDQDKSSDHDHVASDSFLSRTLIFSVPTFTYYYRPIQTHLNGNKNPRAPPLLLI